MSNASKKSPGILEKPLFLTGSPEFHLPTLQEIETIQIISNVHERIRLLEQRIKILEGLLESVLDQKGRNL